MNTRGDFLCPARHLKIDNTALEPAAVAEVVATHFNLLRAEAS